MDFIGSGWQFDVYADGDTVFKRPASSWKIARRLIQNYPELLARPDRLLARVRRLRMVRATALRQLAQFEVPSDLVAGSRMEDGLLVQDRLIPIGAALDEADDPKRLIDGYIDSIERGWEAGLIETSFNFTVNHGLDAEGRVAILDVGEITFDRREAAGLVAHSFWEGAYSTRVLTPWIRRYYLQEMAQRITPTRLAEQWQDARPRKARVADRPAVRHGRVARRLPVRTP